MVGVSHRTAPVHIREQIALDADGRNGLCGRLAHVGCVESVVVSTCNRTEIYAVVDPPASGIEAAIIALLSDRPAGLNGTVFEPSLFEVLEGKDAVRHAYEVACGLDSLVLGETQILAQLRQAYDAAQAQATLGPLLRRMFPATFQVAKKVHTETSISVGAASVGSIAVELAAKIFDDIDRRTALLFGAGDTGETVARALVDRKVARLWIAGHGTQRAAALAERLGAVALPREEAMSRLVDADIVLTAAAPQDGSYLLTPEMIEQTVARRRRELLIIDVGVPRNVDPNVADVANVFLYDLDDLESVAADTRRRRQREVPKARALVDRGVEAFLGWWRTAEDVGPLLRDLHGHFAAVAERELARTRARLPGEHHAAVESLTRSLIDKLLQGPTLYLKQRPDDLAEVERLLRRMFNLSADREGEP